MVNYLISMRKGEVWARILADLTGLGYDVTWLTLGACAVGAAHHRHRVFALASRSEIATAGPREQRYVRSRPVRLDSMFQECGARRGSVMVPTATMTDHKDSRNETSGRQPDSAHHGGTTLGDFAVIVGAMLPSPSASSYGSNQGGAAGRVGPVRHSLDSMARLDLLPSPQSRDGQGRGTPSIDTAEQRFASGRRNLDDGLALLPSPKARDGSSRGVLTQGNRKSPDLGPSVQPERWGRFAAAVQRHAAAFGPPPAPTEPNRNGAPRLAPAFAEWLMCIPAGHVIDALPRSPALKAIGNGVCPPQLAQAWRYLTSQPALPLDTSLGLSLASSLVTTTSIPATSTTSQNVNEIQQRNAEARGRVIEATMALGVTVDPALIQAAMMELAAVWREEAAHVAEAKRKGHVSIAKEYTQAAARLAGFAIGLTTRPTVTGVLLDQLKDTRDAIRAMDEREHPDIVDHHGRVWRWKDKDLYIHDEALAFPRHMIEDGKMGLPSVEVRDNPNYPELCDICRSGWPAEEPPLNDLAEAARTQELDEQAATDAQQEGCAHPASANSTLKSGVIMCTLCQAAVGQVEQLSELVPGTKPGPVLTGDPTMDFLTGAVSEYNPRAASEAAQVVNVVLHKVEELPVAPAPVVVDNPFTSPTGPTSRPPVKRLTYGELGPLIAATYPVPRPHLSHSYVESIEKCGLSALLSDASKAGHVGPRRPSWSLIGGNAFHTAIEGIERASIAIGGAAPDGELGDWEAYWNDIYEAQIVGVRDALGGTPYASIESWHIANKGLEGYDWWRVQGLDMVERYRKHHDNAWRSQHTMLQVPALPSDTRVPVIELPFTVSAGSTAITAEGFIDAAWLSTSDEYPTAALEVVDHKAGKSLPVDHFQLTEYADVLRKHLPPNFAIPIVGRHWRARLGAYTPPIPLPADRGRAEIDYRFQAADRAMRHAVFAPHVDNMCSSCGSVDLCPAQSMRDGASA